MPTPVLLVLLTLSAGPGTAPDAAPVTDPAPDPTAQARAGAAAGHGPYFEMGRSEAVRWRPYGPEAMREAQERGLPILMDVGAMWCHYCRLMSATTYRDPEVARAVERWFVPVKVDRDQMPHLDQRLQQAMLKLTGAGGWPLTAFLTDQGRMFSGGTYFPAADVADGPGLVTVLHRYGDEYQDDKRKYHNVAEETASWLVQSALTMHLEGSLDGVVEKVAAGILADANPSGAGGLGSGAKFPEAAAFRFALERGARGDDALKGFAVATLDAMANGGIRDRLAGGFHRATVDRQWQVPRFEKLLAVNAGLLQLYADAFALTGDERYRRIAGETLDYLLGTLSDRSSGGFYAAQAADLGPGDDGGAYTWTLDEVKGLLDGDAEKVVIAYYQLQPLPGVIPGTPDRNLLSTRLDIAQAARFAGLGVEAARAAFSEGIEALKRARRARPEPEVDRTLYSSLNGLAAGSLLRASARLDREDARAQALKTLDRFLAIALDPERGFTRGIREGRGFGDGLLQDQVYLADALLDAYQASGETAYREVARRVLELTFKRFDDRQGGLLDVAEDGPRDAMFVVPDRPVQDTLAPGANPVAGIACERLARLTGDVKMKERALAIAKAFAGSARRYGPNGATFAALVDRLLEPPPTVIVIGGSGNSDATAAGAAADTAAATAAAARLADTALDARWPGVAVVRASTAADVPKGLMTPEAEKAIAALTLPSAVVLSGAQVLGTTSEPDELEALLERKPLPEGSRSKEPTPPPAATAAPAGAAATPVATGGGK